MIDGVLYETNPKTGLDPRYFSIIKLWARCRGENGRLAYLPDSGSMNEQSSWIMDAFDILNHETRAMAGKLGR